MMCFIVNYVSIYLPWVETDCDRGLSFSMGRLNLMVKEGVLVQGRDSTLIYCSHNLYLSDSTGHTTMEQEV